MVLKAESQHISPAKFILFKKTVLPESPCSTFLTGHKYVPTRGDRVPFKALRLGTETTQPLGGLQFHLLSRLTLCWWCMTEVGLLFATSIIQVQIQNLIKKKHVFGKNKLNSQVNSYKVIMWYLSVKKLSSQQSRVLINKNINLFTKSTGLRNVLPNNVA